MKVVLDIDNQGDVHCLWTDQIDLFAIGKVTNVHKASNVEFHEGEQVWQVLSLDGKILHQNKNREKAIEFEIKEFSPGGLFYVSN
ncbi:hypothetical protein LCGC14_0142520 [marine sediment metagenome]|uniref:Uncharacterized protein n=1 Tax=marine sediment metagenome TaxID=412755 RepID=A0A0F9VGP0_9ZZZZ